MKRHHGFSHLFAFALFALVMVSVPLSQIAGAAPASASRVPAIDTDGEIAGVQSPHPGRGDLAPTTRQFTNNITSVKTSSQSAVITSTLVTAPQASSWQTEEVAAAEYVNELGRRTLALDANNVPHVVYGGGHLFHAWYQGGVWQSEIVDDARGVGDYAAIDLDEQGAINIAYYDAVNQDLKLARRPSGSWVTQTLDATGDVGQTAAIAVNANNNPHIAYLDATNHTLKYIAEYPGYGWYPEVVDTQVGAVGEIALDAAGHPHIVYLTINDGLRYAAYDGSTWTTRSVGSNTVEGLPSLALDTSGRPHIAYQFNSTYQGTTLVVIRAYFLDGVQWNKETEIYWDVLEGYEPVVQVSLVIDAANQRYLSAYSPDGCLAYKENPGVDDSMDCVVNGAALGLNSSLAINSVGYPKIVHSEHDFGDMVALHYASYACNLAGCSWATSTIEQQPSDVGTHNALALDSAGRPQIGYYATKQRNLWHARWNGSSWVKTLVDGAADRGQYVSLAIDPQDHARLSYADVAHSHLKYAYDAGGAWPIETVDASGYVGLYSSIALDAQGRPHIGYLGFGVTDTLKVARYTGSSWISQTIDADELLDGSTLALDRAAHPHLAYVASGEIKYAVYDGAQWHVEQIEATSVRGVMGSIVTDENDRPHVSYCAKPSAQYPHSCTEIHYAYHDGAQWHIQTVDSGSEFGDSALVLRSNGTPVISYYDRTNGDLKFASRVCLPACMWMPQVIDGAGDVGDQLSMKIAPCGAIHISYHDATSHALRHAYRPAPYSIYLPMCRR